jgi:2-C-methyl-D-erythritol 4-phosphate cytidylyltransferase / 2-C-methyl-D-erythritol 2,4-cyclodiphosphate synthase
MAEALLAARRRTRTGQGFDVHRFGPGDHIWLCGIKVAHGQGLIGHSDADVGLHALTDAILGAIAKGDIGEHFPPSDAGAAPPRTSFWPTQQISFASSAAASSMSISR